jgi:hypothetical protein
MICEWSIHKYDITQSLNIQFYDLLMKNVKHAKIKMSSHHKYIGASVYALDEVGACNMYCP